MSDLEITQELIFYKSDNTDSHKKQIKVWREFAPSLSILKQGPGSHENQMENIYSNKIFELNKMQLNFNFALHPVKTHEQVRVSINYKKSHNYSFI